MLRKLPLALLALILMTGTALAEQVEVNMLNKGEDGLMVFEPAFVQLQPGDSVKFIAGDKGHNAESVPDMTPAGAETFKGKINEEIEATFEVPGLYGIKCLPHFAMGMVMTIVVGEPATDGEDYIQGRVPPKAKQRFEAQIANL